MRLLLSVLAALGLVLGLGLVAPDSPAADLPGVGAEEAQAHRAPCTHTVLRRPTFASRNGHTLWANSSIRCPANMMRHDHIRAIQMSAYMEVRVGYTPGGSTPWTGSRTWVRLGNTARTQWTNSPRLTILATGQCLPGRYTYRLRSVAKMATHHGTQTSVLHGPTTTITC